MKHEIEFGMTYEDKISGFRGVATQIKYCFTGYKKVLLCPKVDDKNTLFESTWFDLERLKQVGKDKVSFGFRKPTENKLNHFDASYKAA